MKNNKAKQQRRPLNAQKPYQKYINVQTHTHTCYWYCKYTSGAKEIERERERERWTEPPKNAN